MKKGFTLVELLAVIVILAIILAIAIPGISSIINNATKSSFAGDVKMILKAIDYKEMQDDSFDPSTINETNIESLLNISVSNYKRVIISMKNNKPYIIIIGQNKWNNLVVFGTRTNIIVQEGLVAWYPLDGNANDISVYGNNGTLVNNPVVVDGLKQKAYKFDGSTNYVNITSNANILPKNITVSAWINMDTTASTSRNIFLTNWYGYSCEIEDSTRRPYFRLNRAGNLSWDTYSSENIVLGNWYHFVGTFDENAGSKIYLNGQLKGSSNSYNSIAYLQNSVLNIGRFAGGTYFKGIIQDVRIYNRALSASEILDMYNSVMND